MTTLSELRQAQPHAVEMLEAALRAHRVHHAYLFVGADLAGAGALADAVFAAIACEAADTEPCGTCRGCRRLAGGNHPDVVVLAPDERGSISIEAVRELATRLALRSSESGATKLVRITEADKMTTAAQNALLKTLEEPPGATVFILTTARPRALLATVRSRCQLLRLRPRRREGAVEALVAGGIESSLAALLAPMVGDDVAAAEEIVARGAAELWPLLQGLLERPLSPREVLEAAAESGGDKDRAELLLALLEVVVRDLLAASHGAPEAALYLGGSVAGAERGHLRSNAAARRLQQLRRLRAINVNRTMALESTLMLLQGHERAPEAAPGGSHG